jgi:hypothetical protein
MWSVSKRSWSEHNSQYSIQAMGPQEVQWIVRNSSFVVDFKCSRCVEDVVREETMKEVEVEMLASWSVLASFVI